MQDVIPNQDMQMHGYANNDINEAKEHKPVSTLLMDDDNQSVYSYKVVTTDLIKQRFEFSVERNSPQIYVQVLTLMNTSPLNWPSTTTLYFLEKVSKTDV